MIVCHCAACQEATGGPWPASAAYRRDLAVGDEAALIWELAPVSEHGASRGRCRSCGTVVFWDAPGRDTVSFAAALLDGGAQLEVAAHIWVPEATALRLRQQAFRSSRRGCPRRSACAGRTKPGRPAEAGRRARAGRQAAAV